MKQSLKFFIMGALSMTIVMLTITGFAESISKSIEVIFNSVNLKVNGKFVTVDNILYNDTTYVPLRAVSEMLDKNVLWDESTNTANINDKSLATTKQDNASDEIEVVEVDGKKYVGFRDIQTKHSCFFNIIDSTKLYLYKSSTDFINKNEPLISEVPNRPIKSKSGAMTLGIEYDYYKNTVIPLLEKSTYISDDPKDKLSLVTFDGIEYVSINDIINKHAPKCTVKYYPTKVSLLSGIDRTTILIDSMPFKFKDSKYYVDFYYYKTNIFPILK